MKCFECGAEMVEKKETIKDHQLGLPNVVLKNVPVRYCKKCDEREVVFPQITRLHRLLAKALIMKKSRLAGLEVRFLRKYLGWSSSDLAHRIGVQPETISRWENNHEPIGVVPDRLLRLIVCLEKPVDSYNTKVLDDISDADPKPTELRVSIEKEDYELVGARTQ
jgi:putative zinc finger/helix-turn-helix YgiT family protein